MTKQLSLFPDQPPAPAKPPGSRTCGWQLSGNSGWLRNPRGTKAPAALRATRRSRQAAELKEGERYTLPIQEGMTTKGVCRLSTPLVAPDKKGTGFSSTPQKRGTQKVLAYTEPGMFQLLARSHKKAAKPFQRWLFHYGPANLDVRTTQRNDDVWFVAADVCQGLGLEKNVSQALQRLDPDEKGISTIYTLQGNQELSVISEPGLYKLIARSRKPAAKTFDRWVRHEVSTGQVSFKKSRTTRSLTKVW